MEACECERDNSSNMLQALHFINGKSILGRVQNPGARPAQLLDQKLTDEQLVTELYLWSLARRPTAKELKVGLEFLKAYGAEAGRGGPGPDVGAAQQQGFSASALTPGRSWHTRLACAGKMPPLGACRSHKHGR